MKIVVIGAGGRLGAALTRVYRGKHHVIGFDHRAVDLCHERQIREKIGPLDFEVLINTAALTNVDYCESHREEAFAINAEAPRVLAQICRDKQAKLIHISTDYVFDGEKREPYREEDEARPISVYGESKRAGEENVLNVEEAHLIVRVSWVFGPDRPSFVDGVIKRASESDYVDAIADKFATPTYTLDTAEMLPQFFGPGTRANPEAAVGGRADSAGVGGIMHFANAGECSWQEYGQWALDCCRDAGLPLKATAVGPLQLRDMKNFVARRPVYSVLSTAKYQAITGRAPRTWREAVSDYIKRSYSKI